MPAATIKPTHKPVQEYYQTLRAYAQQQVIHEGAVETAFQRLLTVTASPRGWLLVPKLNVRIKGKNIFPDGTLRDEFGLHHGYWEAKDTDDDLNDEIRKKTAKGYPLSNTIFEDTRRAVLFQNGREQQTADLTKPQELADLLNQFYSHTQPDIEGFEQAVDEFKERVPELGQALVEIVKKAHRDNPKFKAAFDKFFSLCQTALNPNISEAAVDEMLVQHLLTERLFRKVFQDSEFIRRNVIAVEVEKVIAALTFRSFNRDEFLKKLDRFYKAIELAAQNLEDFREKQHFLNTVYERFFQGYSVKVADTHGIVYTPQAIVDFMCASVEEVLKTEFGKELGDQDVYVLDPCTGTGNFIVNLLNRIPKRKLEHAYRHNLFANEVMLLPYYIAALNIEHAYAEKMGAYEAFEGLCFVDTLEMAEEHGGGQFAFMTEKNTERVERQKKTPITVILGNPPYNTHQLDENDNNKNRKYAVIDRRVRETYAKESIASNKNALADPYVKFFRWATDRLGDRDGIVCFVSNNSFIDQIAFDGMRKHLLRDFSQVLHVHLEGNVRHNPKLAGTTHNVFGIQVGVGITVAVRKRRSSSNSGDASLSFYRIDKNLRRRKKLDWLAAHVSISGVEWQTLTPDSRNAWLSTEHTDEFGAFVPLGNQEGKSGLGQNPETVFKLFSIGVKTNRDDVVYDFDRRQLAVRVRDFVESYNSEVDRFRRQRGEVNIDDFVRYEKVKWSESLKANLGRGKSAEFDDGKIRISLYRPFCRQFLYFDEILNERVYKLRNVFPTKAEERKNLLIAVAGLGAERPFFSMAFHYIPNIAFGGFGTPCQCFPFYTYAEDGSDRRENITDWALEQFRTHYVSPTRKRGGRGEGADEADEADDDPSLARRANGIPRAITKWDIFYYVYGLLHHPGYRTKFADNLKRELPRIPFAPDFWAFAKAGKELARLHLDYEKLEPWPLKFIETEGVPLSYRVEDKMRLSKDKKELVVNPSLTLRAIPPECSDYRLGNRSALEWVIDQYQVKEDKRSGIRSDPNRADDAEYIVRLVGQVVRVSVETVKIVKGLPDRYAE